MYRYSSGQTAAQVYDWIYTRNDRYGKRSHGEGAEPLVNGYASLLDVGCGKTTWAWEQGVPEVAGADLSQVAVKEHLKAGRQAHQVDLTHGLDMPDGVFECVVCFDTLEHIQPDAVDFAVSELCRVASKRVVCAISSLPSKRHGRFGEPLHLTIQPLAWWVEKFKKHGKVWLADGTRRKDDNFLVVDIG